MTFPFGSSSALGVPYPGPYSAGPAPGIRTVERQRDGSYMVWPLSVYGIVGDDAVWFNWAFALLNILTTGVREPSPILPPPGIVRCANGLKYNIASQITVPYGAWFDLNQSMLEVQAGTQNLSAVYFHGGIPPYSFYTPGGGIYDGTILGEVAGTGCWGLNYGDGSDMYFRRVRVSGFNAGGGGAIWEQNVNGWTEKVFADFQTFDSTVGFLMDSTNQQTTPSHEYNDYTIHSSVEKSQTAIKIIGQPLVSGIRLRSYGNCFTGGGTADGNSWLDISDTSKGAITISDSEILIQAETTNSGTYNWTTIKTGGTGGGKFLRCHGLIRFAFSNGNWTGSDVAAGNFNFRGVVYEAGIATALLTQQTAPTGN